MPLTGIENTTGVQIHIAVGEPTDYTAANLALLTWAEWVGVVSFGEWGDVEADVSEPALRDDRVIHTNGIADGGTTAIVSQYRTTDAGWDIADANSGGNQLVTILKKYTSGESEVATGILSSARQRPADGNTIRGRTNNFMVNSVVTELSSSDTTTALA